MPQLPGGRVPESTFTGATHECPHPDRWQAWDEYSAEVEVTEFLAGLVRVLHPDVCIETGTAFGLTAIAIGRALLMNGHGSLWTLEVDRERAAETDRYLGGGMQLPVQMLPHSSLDFIPISTPIDFAFFDSDFGIRVAEFRHFRQWMHNRTIVAFHDTAPQHGGGQVGGHFDLRMAIVAELGEQIDLIHLPTPRGLTIGRVR